MSAVTASVASTVNVHYLDHVMTVAEERPVEATEDIYAANGMKLVAKGYAINRSMRDRLLEHQLVKPLEDCMAVSDGVTGARCAQMAEQLLDTHPALRALDLPPSAPNAVKMMADSTYAGRLQTLLTVYNEHRPGKLAHGVCVSLFALNLAQRASLQRLHVVWCADEDRRHRGRIVLRPVDVGREADAIAHRHQHFAFDGRALGEFGLERRLAPFRIVCRRAVAGRHQGERRPGLRQGGQSDGRDGERAKADTGEECPFHAMHLFRPVMSGWKLAAPARTSQARRDQARFWPSARRRST